MVDIVKVAIDPIEAYTKAYGDFDFFSKLAMPHVMGFTFPVQYIAIWQMLVSARTAEERKRILRFALGLPRGFAKTTFIKILICWFIVYDYTTFALIVCADEPLAYNLLADIDDVLGSPNMEAVYGKWTANKATDNKEQKTCMYRGKPIILVAVGANSSVRGLNIKNERPDLIFFDDMQTYENAQSEVESAALKTRFVGTFLKLVDPEFALVIYVGNMYPNNCILKDIKESTSWISLITGCILADGTSLWPELHPIEALYESFKNDVSFNLAHIWFAEMMNDPIEQRTSLLPDGVLPPCPYSETDIAERVVGGCVIIDPAGYRKISDDNVIGVHLLMDDENFVFADGKGDVMNPEEVITTAIDYCIDYNLSLIGIETAAYQQTLKFWMEKYLAASELSHIQVVELAPGNRKKQLRILQWVKELLAGTCHVFGHVRTKILWQALSYKLDKKDNRDDWLDDGAYQLDMRNEYGEQLAMTIREINPLPKARVLTRNTSF